MNSIRTYMVSQSSQQNQQHHKYINPCFFPFSAAMNIIFYDEIY